MTNTVHVTFVLPDGTRFSSDVEVPPELAHDSKACIKRACEVIGGGISQQMQDGQEFDSAFESFWSLALRKVGKADAKRAFKRALKRAPAGVIINGFQRYRDQCTAERKETRFIAHPATWLNGDRWADETPQPPTLGESAKHVSY